METVMNRRLSRLFAETAFFLVTFGSVNAHEFWIDPLDFTPAVGDIVKANLRVGQDFKGDTLPLIPQMVLFYEAFDAEGMRSPAGNVGDRPALQVEARAPGLLVIAYQSTQSEVTFDDPDLFKAYLEWEGLDWVLDEHHKRGLPETGFTELYARYPKTLVEVGGSAAGADRSTGLEAELVALDNPYSLAPGAQMHVQLLWQGRPEAGRQIKIFSRPAGAEGSMPEVVDYSTGADGTIAFAVSPATVYMLNSVKMLPVDPPRDDVVWQSFWSSLTFEIPG